MLNQATKRKLDSARQILVGKVPDPKQQVDQITNALIYKFMDDMDKENEEVGLKVQFFVGEWKKYSWTKLLDHKLLGPERLDLYVQAITNMSKNPHIPQLFRDIFKGAFLPYNDHRTLSLFLKEINEFNYEHSENLGNAFEYLLSCLSAQGDAGMFRTPRHIIDFIVDVVDPKKNETILDPACGTAGFLISAYKHILKANQEKPLTPDEKLKLMSNLAGYDISPGMVKLALVNMYLHGFPEPKIHEYDSLTSEKRWDETFDVILANPPFMTPKGGIIPHKRFSIQAKRAEVLFVDYIVEHLNINGRAGIIVPEGIIFQSNKAYVQLRKKLVEDGLFAIVSLPPGVFNPYSGVKTSILLFDSAISKKTKNFLFVKIQNDGFDLGAQRREHDKNDLPLALEIIEKYKLTLDDKKFSEDEKRIAHIVAKEKIAETGDYNLTGERYKIILDYSNAKWPIVKLGDVVIDMKDGGTPSRKKSEHFGGDIFWCVVKDIKPEIFDTAEKLTKLGLEKSSAKVWPTDSIIISLGATIGNVGIAKVPTATKQGLSGIVADRNKILPEFLARILESKKEYIQSLATGVTIKEVRPSKLKEFFTFPLPPLSVQKEIVEQIEVKQKAIDAAKEVIRNLEREREYFGASLKKIEDIKWVELGELFEKVGDQVNPQNSSGEVVYIGLENIESNSGEIVGEINTEIKSIRSIKNVFKESDILYGKLRPNLNKVWLADQKGICSTDILVLRKKKEEMNPLLYTVILRSEKFNIEVLKGLKGAQLPRVSFDYLSKIKIPCLADELQERYLSDLKKEEEAIKANKKLIEVYEQKISDVLSEI